MKIFNEFFCSNFSVMVAYQSVLIMLRLVMFILFDFIKLVVGQMHLVLILFDNPSKFYFRID
jgi:hypothetical protein